MQVITGTQFLALPKGTLFSFGRYGTITGLFVKEESIGEPFDDFFYKTIIGGNDGAYSVKECPDNYSVIPQRDGCYCNDDPYEFFVIYRKEELQKIINTIKEFI